MKTIKGYQYAVTATEDVTITDTNGLNLTCPAGQQTYFVATTDEVEVAGDAVITQTRGGIIAGSGGKGGSGEKIAPGEVVLGGKSGSQTILDCNTLVDGSYQFYQKPYLEEIDCEFPALTKGDKMFYGCTSLASFSGDLSLLYSADTMFYGCTSLASFSGDLPLLYNGTSMFSGCRLLPTFSSDLHSLVGGEFMFSLCIHLTSFSGNLSSLQYGGNMFAQCKLDLESVNRIVSTIASYSSGSHKITIGVDSTQVTQDDQNAANTILVGKGWTVTWQRN